MQEVPSVEPEEIHSRATIAGHPIHPMLIVFPIATLTGVLVTDFVYWISREVFWAQASFWLLIAAVVTGVVAALAGSTDFISNARIRDFRAAWLHGGLNVVILVLGVVNLALRWGDRVEGVLPWGILISAVSAGLLVVSGWYGGELVYRHGVGVDRIER